MLRNVALASLLVLAISSLPPAASAAVGESCAVSLYTWRGSVVCTGILPEAAYLTWCPVHPTIDCFNVPILTCTVSTTRPYLLCPLLAPLLP